MRFAVTLCLALAIPGLALAKGKPAKASPKAAPKAAKGAKAPGKPAPTKGSAGVAGALSDSDRPAPTPQAQPTSAPAPKGPQRIDFDDRLIEGQSNKSGAVYLYDRKDLQVDSMVKQPSTFRSEIAKGLFE